MRKWDEWFARPESKVKYATWMLRLGYIGLAILLLLMLIIIPAHWSAT